MKRLKTGFVLCLALGLLAGCSSEPATGTVTGNVKYDGKPASGGTITFMAKSGGIPASAIINADGTYRAEGVPAGEVMVAVLSPVDEAESDPVSIKNQGKTGKAPPPPKKPAYPIKYAEFGSSGFSTNVKASSETKYDVEMKK
ncbi:MAG: carboxypeptidase-like regulatory domain-containing protein [Fimbriiglobus sp.]